MDSEVDAAVASEKRPKDDGGGEDLATEQKAEPQGKTDGVGSM